MSASTHQALKLNLELKDHFGKPLTEDFVEFRLSDNSRFNVCELFNG